MRIQCDYEVVNRLLPAFNLKSKTKSSRAQVSVGKKPGSESKEADVYLMLCTKQDRNGLKYKLNGNVEQFFTKFLKDGKATIRFKLPPHDLCLSKADQIQLKGLLSIVRCACQGQSLDKVTLSSLAPASANITEKLRSKLTILTKRDYPVTTGFPRSLQTLQIHDCSLKKIDSRILQLRTLVTLDLSKNHIRVLPDNLDGLPCLADLRLNDNQLTDIPKGFFSGGSLTSTLSHLDLSRNKLRFLRQDLCNLQALVTLKVDANELAFLPPGVGRLSSLRFLQATGNQLKTLPAGFERLRLDTLSLADNAFMEDGPTTAIDRLQHPPGLLEWAARAVRTHRLPYREDDVGPLVDYLDNAHRCLCDKFCFRSHVHYLTRVDLGRVAANVTALDVRGRTNAPCEAFLCSPTCLQRYKKNPNATLWK